MNVRILNTLKRKVQSLICLIKNRYFEHIIKSEFIYKGDMRRRKYYKKHMKSMGENCLIRPGVKIDYPENISIGNNCSIQDNCFISGWGGVFIGNNVSIGNGTKIVSPDHQYSCGIIRNNPLISKSVVIGNNIWIGMSVNILAGSIIHDNTVVGAGTLVRGEIGPGVYVGVPATHIKDL